MGSISLEGWLVKKKSKEKTLGFLQTENRRWFQVREVKGIDQQELALCYFKSIRDKEPRGWIFLKDVVEIFDDKKSFSVASAGRTLCLSTQSPGEHRYWIEGMVSRCPWAKTTNLVSDYSILDRDAKNSGHNTSSSSAMSNPVSLSAGLRAEAKDDTNRNEEGMPSSGSGTNIIMSSGKKKSANATGRIVQDPYEESTRAQSVRVQQSGDSDYNDKSRQICGEDDRSALHSSTSARDERRNLDRGDSYDFYRREQQRLNPRRNKEELGRPQVHRQDGRDSFEEFTTADDGDEGDRRRDDSRRRGDEDGDRDRYLFREVNSRERGEDGDNCDNRRMRSSNNSRGRMSSEHGHSGVDESHRGRRGRDRDDDRRPPRDEGMSAQQSDDHRRRGEKRNGGKINDRDMDRNDANDQYTHRSMRRDQSRENLLHNTAAIGSATSRLHGHIRSGSPSASSGVGGPGCEGQGREMVERGQDDLSDIDTIDTGLQISKRSLREAARKVAMSWDSSASMETDPLSVGCGSSERVGESGGVLPKRPPPPANQPLRRAADVFNGHSESDDDNDDEDDEYYIQRTPGGTTRRVMSMSPSRNSSERKDELEYSPIDFKAERDLRARQLVEQEAAALLPTTVTSDSRCVAESKGDDNNVAAPQMQLQAPTPSLRPPKAPGVKAPYSYDIVAKVTSSGVGSFIRQSSYGSDVRQRAGVNADDNFVSADWDVADDDRPSPPSRSQTPGSVSSSSKTQSGRRHGGADKHDMFTPTSLQPKSMGAGVESDQNWLDENFDA